MNRDFLNINRRFPEENLQMVIESKRKDLASIDRYKYARFYEKEMKYLQVLENVAYMLGMNSRISVYQKIEMKLQKVMETEEVDGMRIYIPLKEKPDMSKFLLFNFCKDTF